MSGFDPHVKELVQAVQELSSAHTLKEIMDIILKSARKIMQADGVTFVLLDEGDCLYVEEDAISPLWKGQRFPLGKCVSGWSILNRKAAVISDIDKDPRIPKEIYQTTFVKSLVVVPIQRQGPVGAIATFWQKSHSPSEEQLDILQALADAVAVAFENVHLLESLGKKVQELKTANQGKNNFLMTLSHELRTPLNSILGWSEILSEYEFQESDVKQGFATIFRNAKLQARIVDDLIESSSIVMGNFQIAQEKLDLAKIMSQGIEKCREELDQKKISCRTKNLAGQVMVRGDRLRLTQVFSNLIQNAIKFSPVATVIELQLSADGDNAYVKVVDQGIGIAAEDLYELFQKFKQIDSSLTRKYGGMGLGLSISRHIVEAHHGTIEVHSEGLGKGTTIEFTLPLAESYVEQTHVSH